MRMFFDQKKPISFERIENVSGKADEETNQVKNKQIKNSLVKKFSFRRDWKGDKNGRTDELNSSTAKTYGAIFLIKIG